MTFAEAMTLNQSTVNSNDVTLGSAHCVWNQTSPPIPTITGLMYTPP